MEVAKANGRDSSYLVTLVIKKKLFSFFLSLSFFIHTFAKQNCGRPQWIKTENKKVNFQAPLELSHSLAFVQCRGN